MKKTFSMKAISVLIICFLLFSMFSFAANGAEVVPFYNNVINTNSSASISSSGVLIVSNSYNGINSVTNKAIITTYVEKKVLGIFWSRVDIGQTNDEWIDTVYNYKYSGTHSAQLSSTGTYRVNVEYVIYGSGGTADTINKQIEVTY